MKTKKQKVKLLEEKVAELEAENQRLKEKAVVDSWAGQVDTMSGAHTQWEIDNAKAWN
jgi:hypothetical protein